MENKFWVKPSGEVIGVPEGHLPHIREHGQEYQLPAGATMRDLFNNGWVRVSDNDIVAETIDNPLVFSNLRDLMISMGLDFYTVWVSGVPFKVTLDEIKNKPFEQIYKEILQIELPVKAADASDMGMGEWQGSWGESESAGSTGQKERGIAYAPQDFTNEVAWNRQLLEYLKKNYPGRKWVMPPEDDIGYPSQASDVVRRLKKQAQIDNPRLNFSDTELPLEFGPETEEYKLLDKLDDEEFQEYYEQMFYAGINVEYNNEMDKFIVKTVISLPEDKPEASEQTRKWEERWRKKAQPETSPWDLPEYRWEIEDVGQGHYFRGNESDAANEVVSFSFDHPDDIIIYEKFRPEREFICKLKHGVIIHDEQMEKAQKEKKERTRQWEERWHKRSELSQQAKRVDPIEFFEQRFHKSPASDPDYFNEWVDRLNIAEGMKRPQPTWDSESVRVWKKLRGDDTPPKVREWEERWHKRSELSQKALYEHGFNPGDAVVFSRFYSYPIVGSTQEKYIDTGMTGTVKAAYRDELHVLADNGYTVVVPPSYVYKTTKRPSEKAREWEERWHKRSKLSQRSSLTKKAELTEEQVIESLNRKMGGQIINFENGGDGTFIFGIKQYHWYNSEEHAEAAAVEQVKNDLDDSPENFNQEWLLGQMDEKAAESFFRDVYNEWNDSYARDIMSERSRKYTNRLAAEMVERGIISEEEGANEDFDLEDKIEEFVEKMTQDQIDEGGGGYEHYKFNIGEAEASKLVLENNLIDIDKAAQDAVDTDGWVHFLNSYDENYEVTNEGVVFFIVDDDVRSELERIEQKKKEEYEKGEKARRWEERWHKKSGLKKNAEIIDTDKVIVPNWYDKESLEYVIDEQMTDEMYEKFRAWVQDKNMGGRVEDEISIHWYTWKKKFYKPETSRKTKDWEERWHKRSSLIKEAVDVGGIIKDWLNSPKRPRHRQIGNWSMSLDEANVLAITHYGTEMITADMTKNVITHVDRGHRSISDGTGKSRYMRMLNREFGIPHPDMIGHEYDANWTPEEREIKEAHSGYTSRERLTELAKSKNVETRNTVAANWHTPAETLIMLSKDKDEEVRNNAIGNMKSPIKLLKRLIETGDVRVRVQIAKSSRVHDSVPLMTMLANDEEPTVRQVLAKSHNSLPMEIVNILAGDTDFIVRTILAMNLSYSNAKDILTRFLTDPHEIVRAGLAQNRTIDEPGFIDTLANDESASVRQAVVNSRRISDETLKKLSADPDAAVRQSIAKSRDIVEMDDIHVALANDSDVQVRRNLAENDAVTFEDVIRKLSTDADAVVRQKIAAKVQAEDIQLALAADTDVDVKKNLIGNWNVTDNVLRVLRRDRNPEIARLAREKLGESVPSAETEEQQKTREWEERWHKRSRLSQRSSLIKKADYPQDYFNDELTAEDANVVGLIGIENHHLTPKGLIAKMREWQYMDAEHNVEPYVYDLTKRQLEAAGYRMPDDIVRGEPPVPAPAVSKPSSQKTRQWEERWRKRSSIKLSQPAPRQFPFDPAIDFRFIEEPKKFYDGTVESNRLDELSEEQYEIYLDLMVEHGVWVRYDLEEDAYIVRPGNPPEKIKQEISEKTRRWEERWRKRGVTNEIR